MSEENKTANTRNEATERLFNLDSSEQAKTEKPIESGIEKVSYDEEFSLQNIFLEKENNPNGSQKQAEATSPDTTDQNTASFAHLRTEEEPYSKNTDHTASPILDLGTSQSSSEATDNDTLQLRNAFVRQEENTSESPFQAENKVAKEEKEIAQQQGDNQTAQFFNAQENTANTLNFNQNINRAPVAGNVDLTTTNEDTAVTFSSVDLLANSSDIDDDSLSVTSVSVDAEYGSISGNASDGWTFNPAENYNGNDVPVSFTVSDGTTTDSATASIDVAAVNDGPVAGNIDLSTEEDTAITFTSEQLLANSSDVDGDSLSVSAVSVESEFGTINENNDGSWTFTPTENYNGNDVPVSFTVSDGTTADSATASIDVTAVNDGPVAMDDAGATITGATDLSNFDLGDMINGAASGVTVTGIYASGSNDNLLDGIDDALTTTNAHSLGNYWPDSENQTGYNYMGGHDWFSDRGIDQSGNSLDGGIITFSDGTAGIIDFISNGAGTTEPAYIYYKPYENLADATSDISTNEDASLTVNANQLLTNDSDADGDILSISAVAATDDTHGVVGLDDDGNIVFTPEENYHGEASFQYTVSDGNGGFDTAMVTVNVESVNDAPTITVTDTTVVEDTAQVIATASDLEGTIDSSALSAEHGTVTIDANGNIIYTPNVDYNGTDTVSLSVTDNEGATTTQTINLTIDPTQDNPVAVDDAGNYLAQLTDINTSNITIEDSASINLNGSENFSFSISVTPEGEQGNYDIIFNKENTVELAFNGNGELQFAMRTEDQSWTWHQTDVSYDVNSVNDIQFSYDGDNVTISNTNSDGETSTYTKSYTGEIIDSGNDLMIGNRPYGGGRYSMNGNVDDISMSVDGTPVVNLDFDGANHLADKSGHGNDATLSQGAGLTEGDSGLDATEDTSLTINASDLLANDTDADGDTLSISAVTATDDTHGVVSLDDGGNIVFTPEENYHGEASFRYTVSDGNGGFDTAMVTVNVESVNDAPVIGKIDLGTIKEDSDIKFSAKELLANSSDADGDALHVVGVSVDEKFGAIEFSTDKEGNIETVKFTPAADYSGDDVPIQFSVSDGSAISAATALIDVESINEIIGTSGNDTLRGTAQNDYIFGGAGNDTIDARGGTDSVNGGTGDDYIYADGSDTIDGGDGFDTVNFRNSSEGVSADNLQNVERVYGSDHDDSLTGSDAADQLYGYAGDDTISGGDGNDRIGGGAGNDTLSGGLGNDIASGNDGDDTYLFSSNGGQDTFHGGSDWTDTIQLEADPDAGDNPWTITVDGEQVEYDLAAGALELQPDTSGVVEMADGSELTFDGVETIQW